MQKDIGSATVRFPLDFIISVRRQQNSAGLRTLSPHQGDEVESLITFRSAQTEVGDDDVILRILKKVFCFFSFCGTVNLVAERSEILFDYKDNALLIIYEEDIHLHN